MEDDPVEHGTRETTLEVQCTNHSANSMCFKPVRNLMYFTHLRQQRLLTLAKLLTIFAEIQMKKFFVVKVTWINEEFFRCQGYVDKRVSYPVVGVAGYCYQTTSGQKRAVPLQLSA